MLTLNAKTRTVLGKKNKLLREKGLIPAVVYGHKAKNQNLELKSLVFNKIFAEAGESSLIDLAIDEAKPVKVLVQDIERDSVTQNIVHVDFHQVREDEKITAETELNFIGESPAVKEAGGVLIKTLDAIKIECLPKDLLHQIDIDLGKLEQIGDIIYVRDLDIPPEVKVLENIDEPIVSIIEPRSQKELEELEEKPEEGALPEGAEEIEKAGEEADKGGETEKQRNKEIKDTNKKFGDEIKVKEEDKKEK
ncbi:50S ribosomal protein L25 [Patescibacteria group bacterium]|nr:50S ribosomal protein L25 [Patescibacteria group bacterium]